MRQHRNRQIAGKSVGDRIADFVDRHMCGVFITPAFSRDHTAAGLSDMYQCILQFYQ